MKLRLIASAFMVFGLIGVGYAWQTPTRSVRDGVYSSAQMKRGETVFQENCAVCHGQDLSGGEVAPALFGGNFMSNWNGLTVGDLSERIRQSMPPDNPDKINQQQRVDVISLILNANGFPDGQKDLETRVEFLKQIKIEPKK
jgi:mono/diheme cytochrome c family protein